MNRDSYTDKTAEKWPHGRDDMVFNRQFWIGLGCYVLVLIAVVAAVRQLVMP